jgi:hypothetical protein
MEKVNGCTSREVSYDTKAFGLQDLKMTILSLFSHYYQEVINVWFVLLQWWINQHEGGYVRSSRGGDKTSLTEGGNCWESASHQLSVQWPLTVSISQLATNFQSVTSVSQLYWEESTSPNEYMKINFLTHELRVLRNDIVIYAIYLYIFTCT